MSRDSDNRAPGLAGDDNEFVLRVVRHLDRLTSPEEDAALGSELTEDSGKRARFVSLCLLQGQVRERLAVRQASHAELRAAIRTPAEASAGRSALRLPSGSSTAQWRPALALATAAALVLAVAAGVWMEGMGRPKREIAGMAVGDSASGKKSCAITGWRRGPGSEMVIEWASALGQRYAIQGTTNLLSGFPEVVSTHIAATPGTNSYTLPIGREMRKFYRVVVER